MLQALSTSLGETFRSIIASFRLSSLFPAICFVSLHRYALLPYLTRLGLPLQLEVEASLAFFLILTALISYALRYLNFPIIRLIEGYPVRNTCPGREMIAWHQARRDWLEHQKDMLDEADAERRFVEDELGDYYPRRAHITPTILGNVMAAFEAYPAERYGIDAVYMWPRILPILDENKYAPFVDREKEGFDFFLNFALLSGILAVELLMLRLFFHLHPVQITASRLPKLTWSAFIAGSLAYFFYRASIFSALSWGETVKSAFDLYRYELAKRLFLQQFSDYADEKYRWQAISRFIQETEGGFLNFEYPLPWKKRRSKEKPEKGGKKEQ